jgi:hypothetical protein
VRKLPTHRRKRVCIPARRLKIVAVSAVSAVSEFTSDLRDAILMGMNRDDRWHPSLRRHFILWNTPFRSSRTLKIPSPITVDNAR